MRWDEVAKPDKKRKLKKFSEVEPSPARKLIDKIEGQRIDEGRKTIKAGREGIEIDQPHHPGQEVHAHLPNGRAVTKSGGISHGGKPFTMKKAWVDALRGHDFAIAKSRLVESEGDTVTVKLPAAIVDFLTQLREHLDGGED